MADKEKKSESSSGAINSNQRFSYIGFEVFPGKPKDLFKSEAEKKKYEADVRQKREQGGVQRDHITLLEERISLKERIILSVACLVILGSLFLPWFSAYQVIEEESVVTEVPAEEALVADSLAGLDSLGLAAATDVATGEQTTPTEALADAAGTAATDTNAAAAVEPSGGVGSEEVIHSAHTRKKIRREFVRMSWFGTFGSFGAVSEYAFSSGVLTLSSILLLVYMVLALLLPIFCLYSLYGLKDKGDVLALKLKRYFRLNWIPVIIFLAVFILSFFGGPYSFDSAALFSSLGLGYSIGVLGDTLSWGIFISLAMFVLVAVKAIEI